jgi:hypothetical protein
MQILITKLIVDDVIVPQDDNGKKPKLVTYIGFTLINFFISNMFLACIVLWEINTRENDPKNKEINKILNELQVYERSLLIAKKYKPEDLIECNVV